MAGFRQSAIDPTVDLYRPRRAMSAITKGILSSFLCGCFMSDRVIDLDVSAAHSHIYASNYYHFVHFTH